MFVAPPATPMTNPSATKMSAPTSAYPQEYEPHGVTERRSSWRSPVTISEDIAVQRQAVAVESDDIEAKVRARSDDLHVVGRDAPQRRAFARSDRRECAAETARVTPFDFDEDNRGAVAADEIDLAARHAHVAADDGVAGRF